VHSLSQVIGVDHFSTLPPELILSIFEHHRTGCHEYNGPFSLIVKSFLHAQRIELYRGVRFHRLAQFTRFSQTILSVEGIGSMVKYLSIGFSRPGDSVEMRQRRTWTEEAEGTTRLMFLRLTTLQSLGLDSTELSRTYLGLVTLELLDGSKIRSLNLSLDDYSLAESILAIFPQLHSLTLEFRLSLPATHPTTVIIRALDPPKLLESLHLQGNFLASSLRNLISSTEAEYVALTGRNVDAAVISLRNSEQMKNLTLEPSSDTIILDPHLLKLTHITDLTLGTFVNLGPTFFTDFFPSCSLQSLELQYYFGLNAADLIRACQKKPASLQTLVIDVLGDSETLAEDGPAWTEDCDIDLMRRLISVYQSAGVNVKGSALEAVGLESESESDFDEDE
jgi:hypothetical protein